MAHDLKSVPEDIIDLKARSMRDNLIFFGFSESNNPTERRAENCEGIALDYCQNVQKVPDAPVNFKIERAHRLGYNYDREKPRPIVVKFNHFPDKQLIKQKSLEMHSSKHEAEPLPDRSYEQSIT